MANEAKYPNECGSGNDMKVDGNVGIGTTDPGNYKLKVEGGNAVVNNTFLGDVAHGPTWAGFSHMNSADSIGYALLQNSNGQYTLINKRSGRPGHIGFRIDNADKMVLTDDGNVGIGTTSPSAALEVANGRIVQSYNDAADFYAIGLRRSGAGGLLNYPDLFGGGTLTLAGAVHGGGVVAISGNVGIGTPSPDEKLHVTGNILLEGPKEIKGIGNGIMLGRKGWERMGFAQDFAGEGYEQVFWGAGVRISASSADPRGENNVAAGSLVVEGIIHATQGVMFADGLQTTAASNGGGAPTLWAPSGSDIYYNAGNVGIGTPSPGAKLEVDGRVNFRRDQGGVLCLGSQIADKFWRIRYLPGTEIPPTRKLILGWVNSTDPNNIITVDTLVLTSEGDVILEEGDLKIKGWEIGVADYVFEDDYKLRELDDLEKYVNANHQLPELPSAEEVRREGLGLSQMTMLLLKKVEELSLYIIEQNKRINDLEARLATS